MNESERNERMKDLEEMKKLIKEEEKLLDSSKIDEIPVEPHDINPMAEPIIQQSYDALPKQQPQSNYITKVMAAHEVAMELDSEKILMMVGITSPFIILILTIFSLVFGMIGTIFVCIYYIFNMWKKGGKRKYIMQKYGV